MNKEAMLSLHTGGSFIVTFNDEKDYEIFKKERSKYIHFFNEKDDNFMVIPLE